MWPQLCSCKEYELKKLISKAQMTTFLMKTLGWPTFRSENDVARSYCSLTMFAWNLILERCFSPHLDSCAGSLPRLEQDKGKGKAKDKGKNKDKAKGRIKALTKPPTKANIKSMTKNMKRKTRERSSRIQSLKLIQVLVDLSSRFMNRYVTSRQHITSRQRVTSRHVTLCSSGLEIIVSTL